MSLADLDGEYAAIVTTDEVLRGGQASPDAR
jgi:hypothetical protein